MVWSYVVVIVLLVIQRLLVHYTKGRRSPHVYILREGNNKAITEHMVLETITAFNVSILIITYLHLTGNILGFQNMNTYFT